MQFVKVIGVIMVSNGNVPIQRAHDGVLRNPVNFSPTAVEALGVRTVNSVAVEVVSSGDDVLDIWIRFQKLPHRSGSQFLAWTRGARPFLTPVADDQNPVVVIIATDWN